MAQGHMWGLPLEQNKVKWIKKMNVPSPPGTPTLALCRQYQGTVGGAGGWCGCYFLNISCSGPGRYLSTVSRMLSSSSSSSSPQPAGIAFLGRVRLPSHGCSRAAFSSASFSSFFFRPYCRGETWVCHHRQAEKTDKWAQHQGDFCKRLWGFIWLVVFTVATFQ